MDGDATILPDRTAPLSNLENSAPHFAPLPKTSFLDPNEFPLYIYIYTCSTSAHSLPTVNKYSC